MKNEKKKSSAGNTAVLSEEELNAVTGGFETFPDRDGVDRHSWFVTLMMNLFHTSPSGTDSDSGKERH